MAYKLAQRGSLDNEYTNVFYCDEKEDLEKIPKSEINLGSVAVVIEPFEMFIAKSNKTWKSLTPNDSISEEETAPVADQGTADNMILGE